jgi:hypothetical protein
MTDAPDPELNPQHRVRVYNNSIPPAADESPLLADGFSSFPYNPEIMTIQFSVQIQNFLTL